MSTEKPPQSQVTISGPTKGITENLSHDQIEEQKLFTTSNELDNLLEGLIKLEKLNGEIGVYNLNQARQVL